MDAFVVGAAVAAVLTPVLSSRFDVRLAIAIVSLPHLAADRAWIGG